MRKCIILLPLAYNDGGEVPIRVISRILRDIDEEFDGHTIAGTAEGAYRMSDGSMAADTTLVVWVACDPERIAVLRRMASRFARILKQESIYFEITDSRVEFVGPEPEDVDEIESGGA
jgi:predicted RNA methylase